MAWLTAHAEVYNLVVNAGMLGVWALYLNLIYTTFRHQNRPNVLITRGGGTDVDSRCLISNMSSHAVHLLAVVVEVGLRERRWKHVVSDIDTLAQDESATAAIERNRQGTIRNGEFIDIGTFGDLVARALALGETGGGGHETAPPSALGEVDWLRITLATVYTAEADMVGATRGFRVVEQGGRLIPVEPLARQLTARRERATLRREVLAQ